jgi:hypothetical protein
MSSALYIPYLFTLFTLPLLARWRRGLTASLIVTVVQLGLVSFVFYLVDAHHLFADAPMRDRAPEHLMEKMRRQQATGVLQLVTWGLFPAAAALLGGGLSAGWSAALAVRRSIRGVE